MWINFHSYVGWNKVSSKIRGISLSKRILAKIANMLLLSYSQFWTVVGFYQMLPDPSLLQSSQALHKTWGARKLIKGQCTVDTAYRGQVSSLLADLPNFLQAVTDLAVGAHTGRWSPLTPNLGKICLHQTTIGWSSGNVESFYWLQLYLS